MEPLALLSATMEIEALHGRDRSREHFKGPRTLDIDILLYGALILHSDDLILPHPGLNERAFALVPVLELDPELHNPADDSSLAGILALLPDQGIYLHAPTSL